MIQLSAPNTTTDYSSYVTKVPSNTDVVVSSRRSSRRRRRRSPSSSWSRARRPIVFGVTVRTHPRSSTSGRLRLDLRSGHQRHPGRRRASSPAGRRPTPRQDARLLRPADLRGGADHVERDQDRLCEGSRYGNRAPMSPQHQAGDDQELDPRRDFKWSTKTNDPLNAKFYIFKIQSDGTYKLVN